MFTNQNRKKVCNFYVSDLHLITMLLPYLDKKIKSNEKIITISQKNLTEEVHLVISRLTLQEKDKKELTNINWNSKDMNGFEELKNKITTICASKAKLNIIINGNKEYIEEFNNKLIGLFENNNIYTNIQIIDCYDITKLDEDIKDILKTHDTILNTSGEKAISEVFEGYERKWA